MRRVSQLRRRRLRRDRQLMLVPRRADDVRPRPAGTVHATDPPQTRLLAAAGLVTSHAPAAAPHGRELEDVVVTG